MPSWSSKDRRMYEHVKESELDRGVPEEGRSRLSKDELVREIRKHR